MRYKPGGSPPAAGIVPSHVAPIVSTTLLFLTKRIYSRHEVFFLIGFQEEFDVA